MRPGLGGTLEDEEQVPGRAWALEPVVNTGQKGGESQGLGSCCALGN